MKKTDESSRNSKPPSLKILTPTKEALELNIKRAHYTAILWNDSITVIMPNLDPCDYGWEKDINGFLQPVMLPKGVPVAPEEVLTMTRCKCSASKCHNGRCSCFRAGLKCTKLCSCNQCENQNEQSVESEHEEDFEDN